MDLLGGCKKLPGCGHAFHTHCLREWLVQQQTCPTCRADIAANEARAKKQRERERAAAAAAAAADERGEEAATGDANNAAVGGDATPQTERPRTDGGDARARGQTTSQSDTTVAAAARSEQQPTVSSSTPTAPDSGALPAGWTQHFDNRRGRSYYYNRELRQSTWDRPGAQPSTDQQTNGATTAHAAMTNGDVNGDDSAQFPCVYRVTFPSGAPVFSYSHSPNNYNLAAAASSNCGRIIPRGKLIVCTSVEYWPVPYQEAMLCMPDGYVRCRDVERYLVLAATVVPQEGGVIAEAKQEAVRV